jgi:hypothetical protein
MHTEQQLRTLLERFIDLMVKVEGRGVRRVRRATKTRAVKSEHLAALSRLADEADELLHPGEEKAER